MVRFRRLCEYSCEEEENRFRLLVISQMLVVVSSRLVFSAPVTVSASHLSRPLSAQLYRV